MKLFYRLTPPDLESRFRQEGLKRDTVVAMALLVMTVFFQISACPIDRILIVEREMQYLAWGIRIGSALIASLALLVIRRNSSVSLFDKVIFAWALLLVIGVLAGNALFPPNYTTHIAWDLLLALAAYTVLPLSLARQVFVALVISVGDIMLFWQYKALDNPGTFYDVTTAFFCANILGTYTAWEVHRWRRQKFMTFHKEADARCKLEQAVQEIKTLQGIIPICSSCKKIRTDEGHWRQVEAYIQEHSDAAFSHSICPECEKLLYRDMDDTDSEM